jgi:hypothetical protein
MSEGSGARRAEVIQISPCVWRVVVPDTAVYLTPPPDRTSRYLVGRVEWVSGVQKFRVTLDEVRVQEEDGRTLSVLVYLLPGTAGIVRDVLMMAWIREFTEQELRSNVMGVLAGRNPLPGTPAAPPGEVPAPPAARRKGSIRSPLSALVDRKAAEKAEALDELEGLISQLAAEEQEEENEE